MKINMNSVSEFRVRGFLCREGTGKIIEIDAGNSIYLDVFHHRQYLTTCYEIKVTGVLEGYVSPFNGGEIIPEKEVTFFSSLIHIPRGEALPMVGDTIAITHTDGFGMNARYHVDVPRFPLEAFQEIPWNALLDEDFNVL